MVLMLNIAAVADAETRKILSESNACRSTKNRRCLEERTEESPNFHGTQGEWNVVVDVCM